MKYQMIHLLHAEIFIAVVVEVERAPLEHTEAVDDEDRTSANEEEESGAATTALCMHGTLVEIRKRADLTTATALAKAQLEERGELKKCDKVLSKSNGSHQKTRNDKGIIHMYF